MMTSSPPLKIAQQLASATSSCYRRWLQLDRLKRSSCELIPFATPFPAVENLQAVLTSLRKSLRI
jgi:hypothetical protein